MKYLLTLFLFLLIGCDQRPTKLEIKALCKSVGDKAFAQANDGKLSYAELNWIEKGAAAECELKYLTGK